MPLTLHGSSEVIVKFDDAAGLAHTITCLLLEVGGAKIEVALQDATAFCDLWARQVPTGMRSAPAVTLSGLWTTDANGPHDLFVPTDAEVLPNAPTRTLEITYATGYTFAVECRLLDYEVTAKSKALTEWAATVQPTGPATWTPAPAGTMARTTRSRGNHDDTGAADPAAAGA